MKLDGDTKAVVTGGAGFLGRHIVSALERRGVQAIVPRSAATDLREWEATRALIADVRPDLVVHGAWTGGGIGFMRAHPGTIARDNTLMALNTIEACRQLDVEKYVGIGSVCAYPKFTNTPFVEEDLWKGYPEETNAPYGISKKMMLVLTQSYAQEFGFNGVHLLMVNLYGPWDNFDLETSHVIPAMIRKFLAAKESGAKEVVLWGDGSPTREFIYVSDAAEAVALAAERYDSPDPVNIGSGEEASIRDLATMIATRIGFEGDVVWDTTKPNGQPKRMLDTRKARERFGFSSSVTLAEGLDRTVAWYLEEGRQIWER
ncbi:MAG: GDP-L-fucose synthase [Myxococcota bacterium]|nr:GDP-L-fucose synthase [Myxococcota bacterium]